MLLLKPLQSIEMKKTIIILYLFISNFLFSQQIKVTRDFGIWGGVNIEKKLNKNFQINLEQQLRFYTNITKFDDYIIDLGGKYKMNKNFKLGANLRFVHNQKRTKEAENNLRYNLDLNYNGEISKKLKFYYRLRYQQTFVNFFSSHQSNTNVKKSSVRHKTSIQHKINKKNKVYFSGELFRLIEQFREPYFNKVRFYIGDKFKSKIGKFNCALGYEQEINTDNPLSFFFIKTIFTLKL